MIEPSRHILTLNASCLNYDSLAGFHISITAKPFFQRMGFAVVKEQTVDCRGEIFTNFAMEKILSVS